MGAYGKGRSGRHKPSSSRRGTRQGKPHLVTAKRFIGIRARGTPKQIPIQGPAAERPRIVEPQKLGFENVGRAWVRTVRIRMKPGRERVFGFSAEAQISFELKNGFIDKKTLKINGRPAGLGENMVMHLNSVLSQSAPKEGMLTIRLRPNVAKAMFEKNG